MIMEENKVFERLVSDYLSWKYKAYPVFASYLGLSEYEPYVGDFSKEFITGTIDKLYDFKRKSEKVPSDKLSKENKIDRVFLLRDIELLLINLEKFRYWEKNPQVYLDEALDGINLLMLKTFRPKEEIAENILKRMKKLPELFREGMKNLKVCPPVFIEVSLQTASHGPEFIDLVYDIYGNINPSMKKDFEKYSRKAKEEIAIFKNFIEKELKAGDRNSYATGKDYFSHFLKVNYMVDKDIDELLATGEACFAEISARLNDLAGVLDPSKSWYETFKNLKRENPGPSGVLSMYMDYMNRAKDYLIENDIVTIPGSQILEVEETPGFIRPIIPVAAYISPGPYDRIQRGVFWVTPPDEKASEEDVAKVIGEHNIYTAMVTAPHEAYPGHHLQLCYSNLQKSPMRKQSNSNIFVEGWGLYCEEMMKETGFLKGAKLELAQQVDQLMRAARVIIDIRLHTLHMTIEEAREFLIDIVLVSPGTAKVEVNRYTMTPGQPLSYMIGQLEILKIREDYKKLKRDSYNLRDFHDEILKCGSSPIKMIRHLLLGEEL